MTASTFSIRQAGAGLANWLGTPRRRLLLAVYTLAAIWLVPPTSPTGESLIAVAQTLLLAVIALYGAQLAWRKSGVLLAGAAALGAIITWLLVTGIWLL